MEKLIIHTIRITKLKEKHIFQIALPENTEAVTGFGVTTDQYSLNGVPGGKIERSTGILQLFASDTGEHLFTDDPKNTFTPTKIQAYDELFGHRIWSYKSHFGMLDTWQPIHTTILDGFYRDFMGDIAYENSYNLRIYVRLKLR